MAVVRLCWGQMATSLALLLVLSAPVAALAQHEEPTPAEQGSEKERFGPYWSPQWAFFDSHPFFEVAFFSTEAPLGPDLSSRRWSPESQHGILIGAGGRFLLGPLLLDLGLDVSSPLFLDRGTRFHQTLPDYGSAGFLRFVSHHGAGFVTPPFPNDGTTRLSVHAEIGIGTGGNLTYPHMVEFTARPAVVFSVFGRTPEKQTGAALVLKVGRLASLVPRPDGRVRVPDQPFQGVWAHVGLRIIGPPHEALPQPAKGLVRPKPKPKPDPEPVELVSNADTDGDGIFDPDDGCVDEVEDFDGWDDADGCPDLDNDEDGIPDTGDGCPNDPETWNSYFDADGCPDEVPRALVEFVGIIQGIQFQVASDQLLPTSLPLLDQAAQVVLAFPDILVQIQGHSSSEGDATQNLELSWLRAEAVRGYLITKGVPPERVRGKGFGSTVPVAGNDTETGRKQNRRVEFKVIKSWEEAE